MPNGTYERIKKFSDTLPLKDVMEWMISNLTLVRGVRLCIRNWLNFFSPSKAALNISSTLGKAA